MKEHNGENPQNARIKINYTGKKPKVSFSYPLHKKDAMSGTMLTPLLMIWMIINLPLIIYISWNSETNDTTNLFNKTSYNISDYSEFVNYYTQPNRLDYYYKFENLKYTERLKESFVSLDKKTLWVLVYFFGGFILLYFPFRKKWNKLFPDYQALGFKKYKNFTSKDITTKDKEVYLELPVFKNIVCDFNATKDFSKYLKEFKIEEYKFSYYRKTKLESTGKKGRRRNEFIWYARWYFTQEPKEGNLEVLFR